MPAHDAQSQARSQELGVNRGIEGLCRLESAPITHARTTWRATLPSRRRSWVGGSTASRVGFASAAPSVSCCSASTTAGDQHHRPQPREGGWPDEIRGRCGSRASRRESPPNGCSPSIARMRPRSSDGSTRARRAGEAGPAAHRGADRFPDQRRQPAAAGGPRPDAARPGGGRIGAQAGRGGPRPLEPAALGAVDRACGVALARRSRSRRSARLGVGGAERAEGPSHALGGAARISAMP